jgi:hypothetical protein
MRCTAASATYEHLLASWHACSWPHCKQQRPHSFQSQQANQLEHKLQCSCCEKAGGRSRLEQQQLLSVCELAGYLAPGLRLLVHDVLASSNQLQHLYADSSSGSSTGKADRSPSAAAAAREEAAALDPDAATAYLLQARRVLPGGFCLNPRLQLSGSEEQWLLHAGEPISSSSKRVPAWRRFGLFNPIQELPQIPLEAAFVKDTEQQLQQGVVPAAKQEIPKYPLQYNKDLPLEKEMHEQLKRSWECYHSHPEPTEVVPGAAEIMRQLQVTI